MIDDLSRRNQREILVLIAGLLMGIAASLLVAAAIPDFAQQAT